MDVSATTEIYDNFVEKNDYQSALPIASQLVTIRGEAQDWLAQGICQTVLGQFDEAMESFSRTIDIDPSNYLAWSNVGGILNSIGKVEEALLCFYEAIEIEPNNLEVLTNLATALSNTGKYQKALDIFDYIVQQEPEIMMAWANRGLTLGNLKRYDEALCSFEKALQIEPNDEIALVNKGSVLLNLYRYDEALTAYDLALQFNPDNVDSWLGKGIALANTFQYEEAFESIYRAIKLDENNPNTWAAQGIILSELKCYDKALDSFNKSIKLGKQSFLVFINRAKALLALNNWPKGIEALDFALNHLSDLKELEEQKITTKIVENLLFRTTDLAEWRSKVSVIEEIYKNHNLSYLLAEALIDSVSRLVSRIFSLEKVRAWRDIWEEIVGDNSDFETSIRLLNTAVEYRELGPSPFLYLELSQEEKNLFKYLLGVEEVPNQLNESQLIINAGKVALTGYKLLGRGFVCFFGEKPEYISRNEIDLLSQLEIDDDYSSDRDINSLIVAIDEYSPEKEFILIPSNHQSYKLVPYDEIGLNSTKPIPDEEYKKELEKLLFKLEQQGLNNKTINNLRRTTLELRGQNLSEVFAAYPPEILAILQKCSEEEVAGNLKPFVDFFNLFCDT